MSNKYLVIIVSVFVISFIVLKVYKPPIENYTDHTLEERHEEIREKAQAGGLKEEEINTFLKNLERQDELFIEQEQKQNLQNKEISLLKQKVSDFRNDLVVLRNNDKQMMDTLSRSDIEEEQEETVDDNSNYSSFNSNTSSVNNIMSPMSKNDPDKSNISGKSYNLNFNLDED